MMQELGRAWGGGGMKCSVGVRAGGGDGEGGGGNNVSDISKRIKSS